MTLPLARLTGVVRRFGPVEALAGANLEVRAGEVHAVLGENGAGKSTLLGILGGILRPDAGTVEVRGRAAVLSSPRAAWSLGIGLVHQHFTLVPTLTVLENLALGSRDTPFRLTRTLEHQRHAATELMERTGLRVPLDAPVERLAVGDRQRVEILKVLLREPSILVLDEPTATLSPREVESLFSLLRKLVAEGRAVVLVAHKIDEVLAVAGRVTVLRRGRTTLSAERALLDARTLVRAMLSDDSTTDVGLGVVPGVDATRAGPPPRRERGTPVARVVDARVRTSNGVMAVNGVSLEVARGEIVGVVGVEGNGQRELALLLAGRLRADAGTVHIPSRVGFIPQDRTAEGLVQDFDLTENVALALHDDPRHGGRSLLHWDTIREQVERIRARFGLVAGSVTALAHTLSGGNQQRLVVGRELLVAADLLIAENPTRGLDVAATGFVQDELRRVTTLEGPGVVLVSTDLDEVLALADRVLVMSRGKLVSVPDEARTREGVGALMLGGEGVAA